MAAENFKVKKGLEVGTGITANSDGINVTGIITATQYRGDGSGLTGVVASGTGIVIKEEGTSVGTAGTINFVGNNILATLSEGTATVTVNSGALDNVVEDTTPQLGGNLDLNSKFVTGSGGINVTGIVTATTGDFVDIDVDGQTELDDLNVSGITTLSSSVDVDGASNFGADVVFAGDAANITFDKSTDDLIFDDGAKAIFGSSSDGIEIFHSGDVSRIRNNKDDANFLIQATSNGENAIKIIPNGAVELFHNGNQKLTTTINGIEVPDLNVTGVGTVGRLDTDGVVLGTNGTTFAAKFADNAVANFGTDNDLKISHDDTHAKITNTKGDIVVSGIISATSDVKVGSAITMDPTSGIITATSFSGSGANLTNIPSAQLTGALPALDGSALTNVTGSGSGIVVQHDGTIVGTAGTINFSTNLDVSAISAGIVTVTASGGGGGGSQNLFSTIAVSGQDNIVADATTDTLTFAEGSNITITTNAGTDTITIASDQISTEEIQDIVGAMFSSNTETDITATYQDDDGTIDLEVDLTSLNADNLDSGTIPNGRFPATLPATSGANLTNLTAGNISGTIAESQIADNAVSFAKMRNISHSRIIGRAVGTTEGDPDQLTGAQVRAIINVADGATNNTPSDSDVQVTYDISGGSGTGYIFTGPGYNSGIGTNPTLYLVRGQRYRFINTTGSQHPFAFRNGANDADYTTGITGSQNGTQDFNVPYDAPEHLMYRCTIHTNSMKGNIYIVGGKQSGVGIGTIVGILTATGFSGSGADLTGLTASQIPFLNADKIDSGTFNAARIPDLNANKINAGTLDAGRIPTLNQDTTGNAGTFTVTANNSTNETVYPVFVDGATGSQGAETDTGLSYNPNSGNLTSTKFTGNVTGNVTGNLTGNISSSSGNVEVDPATQILEIKGDGSSVEGQIQLNCHVNSHGQKITAADHSVAASNTLTLPGGTTIGNADATLVSDTGTQTLTNKTLTSPTITGTGAIAGAFTGDVTGNADSATALETARNIGGVSFDGTSDINLPGVNQAGNQNTSGTAAGLSGTPDITVNNVVGAAATFVGIATVTGSVEVGTDGVGIGVTLDQGGGVYSGIVTATKFSGSGEDLTGLTASQIPNLAASKITSGTFNAARIPTLNQDTTGNAATADKVETIKKDDLSTGYLTFVADNNTNATAETVFTATGITVDSSADKITATTFVGALTGSASGSSGSCTGNSATATALETARNIGGVSFDGTGNINLPGVNEAGTQNTSGDAGGLSGTPDITVRNVVGVAATFSGNVEVTGDLTVNGTTTTLDTVVTEVDKLEVAASNATVGVAITQSSTGDILNLYDGSTEVFSVADGGNVTSTGELTATKFIKTTNNAGFLKADGTEDTNTYVTSSGNVATATALQNARTIGGVSFDGTANINLPGVNSAGNQNTSGNAATATLATDATSFTVSANNSNNETVYPVFVDGATGSQGAETDTALTYNPSTNVLRAETIGAGQTANISSGTATIGASGEVDSVAVGSCDAIEYTIFVSHASSGIQSQKVLIMHDGSTAYSLEFSVMFSSSLLLSFSTNITSGNVKLLATRESGITGNTSVKFIKSIIN